MFLKCKKKKERKKENNKYKFKNSPQLNILTMGRSIILDLIFA